MQSLDPARLARNYAFCTIFPLFRRRYDRAVVGRTNEVPMKRFIVVAAGVASLPLCSSKLSAGNGATEVGVATGITAASLNGRSDTIRDWFIF